jgi:hypothetical protein
MLAPPFYMDGIGVADEQEPLAAALSFSLAPDVRATG